MNAPNFSHWLPQHLAQPGVLAGAILQPDAPVLAQSFSPRFTEEGLRALCQGVHNAFEVAQAHHLPAGRMRWTFHGATVCAVRREDGGLLLLLVDRKAAATDASAVDALLAQFLQLS